MERRASGAGDALLPYERVRRKLGEEGAVEGDAD
jgi:hypothetical protein